MAVAPKQNCNEPGFCGHDTLSQPSSSASSAVLSSDSWQSVSPELLFDEHTKAFGNAATSPNAVPPHIFPLMPDPDIEDSMVHGWCPVFNPQDMSLSMNNSAIEILPSPHAAWSTCQFSWMDPLGQSIGQTIPANMTSSSLLADAGDSMEMTLSYDQVATPAYHGRTSPSMSETLLGLSLHVPDDLNGEDHATLSESANTWMCDIKGCTKQFKQQHKYK